MKHVTKNTTAVVCLGLALLIAACGKSNSSLTDGKPVQLDKLQGSWTMAGRAKERTALIEDLEARFPIIKITNQNLSVYKKETANTARKQGTIPFQVNSDHILLPQGQYGATEICQDTKMVINFVDELSLTVVAVVHGEKIILEYRRIADNLLKD